MRLIVHFTALVLFLSTAGCNRWLNSAQPTVAPPASETEIVAEGTYLNIVPCGGYSGQLVLVYADKSDVISQWRFESRQSGVGESKGIDTVRMAGAPIFVGEKFTLKRTAPHSFVFLRAGANDPTPGI